MAGNTQVSDTAANAAVNALTVLANSGYVKIYTSPQPANANTAVSSQTLLSTHTLSATAFASASGGVATANAVGNATAAATGTAAWFRVLKSDGTTVLFDGNVSTSGANLNLNSTAVQSGATVSISSFTFTLLEAGS